MIILLIIDLITTSKEPKLWRSPLVGKEWGNIVIIQCTKNSPASSFGIDSPCSSAPPYHWKLVFLECHHRSAIFTDVFLSHSGHEPDQSHMMKLLLLSPSSQSPCDHKSPLHDIIPSQFCLPSHHHQQLQSETRACGEILRLAQATRLIKKSTYIHPGSTWTGGDVCWTLWGIECILLSALENIGM